MDHEHRSPPHAALPYLRRRPARVVQVGDVPLGGTYPIRVQSMTTARTTDTPAVLSQIARLVEAGCEIVRLAVPTSADAENLPRIRRELRARGIRVPLVADIHFTPAAAMLAVEHVEKIRINPGNFADKKKFAVRTYTEAEYQAELERIERVFAPLVRRCKELGVAMRIGTNHGSLSDRILNRYGDTPEGMVESALEFVRICEAHGFHDLVLSMKASNPVVVLQAYRLLARRLDEEAMDYPIHLGVTEAGEGDDARIKSAIGIGALLEEGIGDTVRVSLTEDPVAEIPVARALVAPYNARREALRRAGAGAPPIVLASERHYARRRTRPVRIGPRVVGAEEPVLVEVALGSRLGAWEGLRREIEEQAGAGVPRDVRAELVSVRMDDPDELEAFASLRAFREAAFPALALSALWEGTAENPEFRWRLARAADRVHIRLEAGPGAAARAAAWLEACAASGSALLCEVTAPDRRDGEAVESAVRIAAAAARAGPLVLALDPASLASPLGAYRWLAGSLEHEKLQVPVVLLDRPHARSADPLLGTPGFLGALLCEGIGDAVQLELEPASRARSLAYSILQAARVRMTRTEFISCPSCGRTLFDLEETTARIRARTGHLKGVKIAVMGCIVNGPGEMADADFGYVGWGEGKVALFVGRTMVAKDIPTEEADARLVELIQAHGRWVEPPG